jgi:CRISPR-associated endonuclease/helicase Cas3
MVVTFISQCEKKALNRTRRVLDAFADRIGDNTWQTVITQEGLLAVKKLLRKTASKNTAVSCHWLRSRSRSELIWVVGNKNKFDAQGRVPVNFTQKEVPMDIAREKPITGVDYTNTQLQRLDQHLFAVGYLAKALFVHFYGENEDTENLSKVAYLSGCFHDIGKLDSKFQKWVVNSKNKTYVPDDGQHIDKGSFNFDKHPRHNEISVLLYHLLDDATLEWGNSNLKQIIKHVIYWHHAKPFRTQNVDSFSKYGGIYRKLEKNIKREGCEKLIEDLIALLERVQNIEKKYQDCEQSELAHTYLKNINLDDIDFINLDSLSLPAYKLYHPENEQLRQFEQNSRSNAKNNQIRACVITADRWVSAALSGRKLSERIKQQSLDEFLDQQIEAHGLKPESDLAVHIEACLANFPQSGRTQKQIEVAEQLSVDGEYVKVLAGAAGCGKTKIALEWALRTNAQKILWICPRVQICQGLFTELRASDLDTVYLPNANVELHTGEYKYLNSYNNPTPEKDYFSGDIVITTIDQILGAIVSHTKADRLLNFLAAHVVFDEYHEYIQMPAFNLLLVELINCKRGLVNGVNTLLVSATPHYTYLEKVLDIDCENDVIEMPSFNPCRYKLDFEVYDENQFDDTNPLYKTRNASTFVISNTATTAQKSFLKNQHDEELILLHSKFKKSDKRSLFDQVFESFKRDGSKQFDVLRSGPIVQASLNISCNYMVTEITTAENMLQRLGRLDRFGQNQNAVNTLLVAIPETLHEGSGKGAVARFLASNKCLGSTKAWYRYLREGLENGTKDFILPELYDIYKKFYTNESGAQKVLEEDLLSIMKVSAQSITAKLSEPQVFVKPKNKTGRAKISRNSLRGDSVFVQMAVCDLTDKDKPQLIDRYAYEISVNESADIDNLTESVNTLNNHGLIDYAAQKHGRIDEGHPVKGIPASKTKARKAVIESSARDPEYPVYLSYTESEMAQKLGETKRYSEASYYTITEKQVVGLLRLKHFTHQED